MALRKDRVRVLAFIKKVDSVSKEEFSRYWVEEHSKIFMSMAIAKKNLLKYEQVGLKYPGTVKPRNNLLRYT